MDYINNFKIYKILIVMSERLNLLAGLMLNKGCSLHFTFRKIQSYSVIPREGGESRKAPVICDTFLESVSKKNEYIFSISIKTT